MSKPKLARANARPPLGQLEYLNPEAPDPQGSRRWLAERSSLLVAATSWSQRGDLVGLLQGATAAAYVLEGTGKAPRLYIGESASICSRLSNHARDPEKSFVQAVYVVACRDGFTKGDQLAAQYELARLITLRGHGAALVGSFPRPPKDADGRLGRKARRFAGDALAVLAAQGCATAQVVRTKAPGAEHPLAKLSVSELQARGGWLFRLVTPTIRAEVVRMGAHAVLLAGSELSRTATRTCSGPMEKLAAQLQASEVATPCLRSPGLFLLHRNIVLPFTAVSTLSSLITGSKATTLTRWKPIPDLWADDDSEEASGLNKAFGMPISRR